MPMTVAEAGSLGGKARARNQSRESLRGIGSLGYLRRAVIEVCRRVDELSEDDKDRLHAALYGLDGDAA